MLCPRCGTPVGELSQLCLQCAAAAARENAVSNENSAPAGSSIGAIRPATRVVHLAPGQTKEEALANLRRTSASAPPSSNTSAPRGFGSDPLPQYERANRRPWWLLILSVLLVAPGTYWVVTHRAELTLPALPQMQSTEPPRPDYSHIVIHERKEIVVDGKDIVGAIFVESDQVALNRAEAIWHASPHQLELRFYKKVDEASTPPPAGNVEKSGTESAQRPAGIPALGKPASGEEAPEVVVSFELMPDSPRADPNRLRAYSVTLNVAGSPYTVSKQYSKQLAAFGEVAQLGGLLKDGETLRVEMHDERTVTVGGAPHRVRWELLATPALQVKLGK